MNTFRHFVADGGPVMWVIIGLAVVLYTQCASLLLFLRSTLGLARRVSPEAADLHRLRTLKAEIEELYSRRQYPIAAMIAAAPLLGLLGTVSGMVGTFESLSRWGSQQSMEGLAGGISEVLICTESGLAVAIPGVLILAYAHRLCQKSLHHLTGLEARIVGSL